VRVLDVGFDLGGQSDVRYLVLQVHYKFAYTGSIAFTVSPLSLYYPKIIQLTLVGVERLRDYSYKQKHL